jgi:hypothetical protein
MIPNRGTWIEGEKTATNTLKAILDRSSKVSLGVFLKGLLWSVDEQKAYEKKKKEFLKELKMSKDAPTKKQLYYYEKLCKKYGLEQRELTSKLDARDEIDRIINDCGI